MCPLMGTRIEDAPDEWAVVVLTSTGPDHEGGRPVVMTTIEVPAIEDDSQTIKDAKQATRGNFLKSLL